MGELVGIAGTLRAGFRHDSMIPVVRERSSIRIFKLTHYRTLWPAIMHRLTGNFNRVCGLRSARRLE
jgi:hypothetical protein